MKSVRNIALVLGAGSLLGAAALVSAHEAKPQAQHAERHAAGEHKGMHGQGAQRMVDMHARMQERHAAREQGRDPHRHGRAEQKPEAAEKHEGHEHR
jgi:hypothetical protein